MLSQLVSYFEPNEDVLGLLLFGSGSGLEFRRDEWSDIDLLVVVKNDSLAHFFPTVDWITSFGPLYAFSQSSDDYKSTTRTCFEDFERVDFVFATEEQMSQIDRWSNVPFFSGTKLLFSRSTIVDQVAPRHFSQPAPVFTDDQFHDMVRQFRFKSMLAVYKAVRNDLLIAQHLSLDLIRDCSVLGMMLRDRATETNIHKHGGLGNELAAKLEIAQKPFTPMGILDSIQESNTLFEKLASEWSNEFQEKRQLLFEWIEKARAHLSA